VNQKLKRQALQFVGLMLLAASPLSAQTAASVPLPAQLATAHTAFISNAGGSINSLSQQAYVIFYRSLLGWKHFQLTSNPADADVILELSSVPHEVANHTLATGSPQLILNIRDVKTQTILWSFTELIEGKSPIALVADKDISDASARLITDMNTLLASSSVSLPTKKARFAQEKP